MNFLTWLCENTYLVDSTVEKGPREIERLLGADGPVTAQIQPVDKNSTFLPALWTQTGSETHAPKIHNIKALYFLPLTVSFTNVSLGYPYANSLPMKNPGYLGISGRACQGAWKRLRWGIHFKYTLWAKWEWKCNVRDSIKHTNLSIKLGFISRLYIVKFRNGILFNKMSPTRPARIQIRNWLVHYPLSVWLI